MINRSTLAAFVLWALLASSVGAAELTPDRQAAILIRAVAYDRGLKARVGPFLDIVVLSDGSSEGAREASEVQEALRGLGGVLVQGAPMRAVAVTAADPKTVAAELAARRPDVVWICGNADATLEAVLQAAQNIHFTTVSTRAALVDKGSMLSLELIGGAPRMVVNLTNARAAGVDFPAELLKLARVIR